MKKLSLIDRTAFEIVGIINSVDSPKIEVVSNNEVYILTLRRDVNNFEKKDIKKGDRIFAKGRIRTNQELEIISTVIFNIHTGGIIYALD